MCEKGKIISSRCACYCLSQFRVSLSILLIYKGVLLINDLLSASFPSLWSEIITKAVGVDFVVSYLEHINFQIVFIVFLRLKF